ncbi:hypothetical protein AHAS_Ahas20G0221900 [Arachis hypogaea]
MGVLYSAGEFLSPRNYIVFKLKANNVIWYYLSSQGIVKPGKKTNYAHASVSASSHLKAAISFGLCTIEASDPPCRSAVKRVLKLVTL